MRKERISVDMGDHIVSYNKCPKAVFDNLVPFCLDSGIYNSETLWQKDGMEELVITLIEDILDDLLEFEVEEK